MDFFESVQKFKALTEAKGDPAFRDYSQSAHLGPKPKGGLRKENFRSHLASQKLRALRSALPKQSNQEVPSPLPGYIRSKDMAEKYRGQLHDKAVKRLRKAS